MQSWNAAVRTIEARYPNLNIYWSKKFYLNPRRSYHHFDSYLFNVPYYRLCEKSPYSVFLWSVFERIGIKYRVLFGRSPYLVRIGENIHEKISEFEHFLRSDPVQTHAFFSFLSP